MICGRLRRVAFGPRIFVRSITKCSGLANHVVDHTAEVAEQSRPARSSPADPSDIPTPYEHVVNDVVTVQTRAPLVHGRRRVAVPPRAGGQQRSSANSGTTLGAIAPTLEPATHRLVMQYTGDRGSSRAGAGSSGCSDRSQAVLARVRVAGPAPPGRLRHVRRR
jgi:hypothetical protein